MTRGWLAGLVTGALIASSCAAALSAPSKAGAAIAPGLVELKASSSPPPPPHSARIGPVSAGADVHLDVTLKLPDPAAVTSFITALSQRGSPEFDHFLLPGQFGQLFGPSLSEVSRVEALLGAAGLHPGPVTSDRLFIPVTAPASAVDRAFHVKLVRYELPGGRVAFTTLSPPRVSAGLAGDIDGVVGLNDLVQAHDLLAQAQKPRAQAPEGSRAVQPRTVGPTPCPAASYVAAQNGAFTADELASYYGMTPLYSLGDFGQGVHVAIAEFEQYQSSDIATYQACYGTNATVNNISVPGGATSPQDTPEAALDIENVIGLAPSATIDVYQAPNTSNEDVLAVYSAIVNNDADPVVSTSWGECEPDEDASDSSFRSSEQVLFQQAATQGQSVFAAAGDTGSADCFGDKNSPNQQSAFVDDPASQPFVVGVGGTSISGGTETVWNDALGSGGGGVSSSWCMPSYQDNPAITGLISSLSVQEASCPAGGYMREVPDVSADADPDTAYVIYWNQSWWGTYAGTSGAAPLWAAAAALIDASPFCADYGSGNAGVRPAALYELAALGSPNYGLALNDITTGSNDWVQSPIAGGLYPATVGYDMASGLGTPRLSGPDNYYPGLAAQMCLEYRTQLVVTKITDVSPNAGPSGQPTTVTITGAGFLPIPGADHLEVGTDWVAVDCPSTTSCTASLPTSGPRTVDLVMSVEDTTLSPLAASDQFTYAAPPSVAKVTPDDGPEVGETKVTIQGSNFVGAVSVRFGAKPAAAVKVVSESEITAYTPSGSGPASVSVTAVGGSSPHSLEYTFLAAPTIAKITPAVGPTKGGTKVTIRGRNFLGTVSVRFGTKKARSVHVISSSELSVAVPSGSGDANVVVSALGGSSRTNFATRGTKVTIHGANFVGAVSLRFGRKLAKAHLVSSSEITATAPPGSGTVYVVVTAVGGVSNQDQAAKYSY
ncbi:MAG: IPT/TIG domain-containing protein [Acidimicrobiales bacterium]